MTALRLVKSDHIPECPVEQAEHFAAPKGETKAEKVRRQNRDRKQKQRRAEAQAKLKAEAFHLPAMTFYGGTVQAMIDVCRAGGFEEPAEALTLLAHGSARLAETDRAAFEDLLKPVLVLLATLGADLAKRDSHAFALLVTPPSRSEAAQ